MAVIDLTSIAVVLGGPRAVGNVRTIEDLVKKVHDGLPWKSFTSLRSYYQLPDKEMCAIALLKSRTLLRRKNSKFTPDESDRLVRLARVFANALDVFEDKKKAALWITRPNRAFGGKSPLKLLDNDLGIAQVNDELGRIKHGVFT